MSRRNRRKPYRFNLKGNHLSNEYSSNPTVRGVTKQPAPAITADKKEDTDRNDIPGFFYDPETKTHFRITPENKKYFTEKLKVRNLSRSPLNRNPSRTSISRRKNLFGNTSLAILAREYNCITGEGFRKQVLTTRLKMLKEVRRAHIHDVLENSLDAEECQMMVGNPEQGSLVGAWKSSNGTALFNHSLQGHEGCAIIGLYYTTTMTDLCIAKIGDGLEFVLYVGNPSRPNPDVSTNKSTMHLCPIRHLCDTSTPENRYAVDSRTTNCELENTVLWSCAWNQQTQKMAFGTEGKTIVMSSLDSSNFNLCNPKENIFSLEFNKLGNLLYCGTNKGNLNCFDLRSHKQTSRIALNRGLSYLKLLSLQEQIIASCYDNKLLQVDLRANRVVVEYADHNNEHLKIPFSLSEKNDFLCSAGQDRVTRIWNLKTGSCISSIPAPSSDSSSRNWVWFSEEWNFRKDNPETALVMCNGQEFITYKS